MFVIGAVCLLLLFGGCARRGYGEIIRANWDLALPSGYTELYQTDTGESFLGDGVRYHVFGYEDGSALEEAVSWQEEPLPTRYSESQTDAAAEFLEKLDVPSEWSIPGGDCRYSAMEKDDGSELLLFWHLTDNRLYLVENFL